MYGELEMTTVLWVLFSGHLPHVGCKSGQAGTGALEKTYDRVKWQDIHIENKGKTNLT